MPKLTCLFTSMLSAIRYGLKSCFFFLLKELRHLSTTVTDLMAVFRLQLKLEFFSPLLWLNDMFKSLIISFHLVFSYWISILSSYLPVSLLLIRVSLIPSHVLMLSLRINCIRQQLPTKLLLKIYSVNTNQIYPDWSLSFKLKRYNF